MSHSQPSYSVPPATAMTSVDDALDQLLQDVKIVGDVESVDLVDARGRVLAEAQTAAVDVPPDDNSSMDGYAVRCVEVGVGKTALPVSQRIVAGSVGDPLKPGTAARIFTGAPIPKGADAVVMQEQCEVDGSNVDISRESPLSTGNNIRLAGEDIRQGDEILSIGTRLRAQDIGLAASVGLQKLPVFRRLRVAILSTGDELASPGDELKPGQKYNSNRFTLNGLLVDMGCEVIDLGVIDDTLEATRDALFKAADNADLIISSGGVSVGEEDYVRTAVEELGKIELWKIAIKPGKPLAYGKVGYTAFMGLPGNPVSTFVTFILVARPYLLKKQGATKVFHQSWKVRVGCDLSNSGSRQEYLRARLSAEEKGEATAEVYPNQSSGVLASVSWADGLLVVPIKTAVKSGDFLEYIPFSELLGG
ncbi:gephyrin-like molybdotransferase Glp [Pseudomonadota bacterium]